VGASGEAIVARLYGLHDASERGADTATWRAASTVGEDAVLAHGRSLHRSQRKTGLARATGFRGVLWFGVRDSNSQGASDMVEFRCDSSKQATGTDVIGADSGDVSPLRPPYLRGRPHLTCAIVTTTKTPWSPKQTTPPHASVQDDTAATRAAVGGQDERTRECIDAAGSHPRTLQRNL